MDEIRAPLSSERHFELHNKHNLLKASLLLQNIQGSEGLKVPDWLTDPPTNPSPGPTPEESTLEPALKPSHSNDLRLPQSPASDLSNQEIYNALKELEICFSTFGFKPPEEQKSCLKLEPALLEVDWAESTTELKDPEIYAALKELETCFRMVSMQAHSQRERSLGTVNCARLRVCKKRGRGCKRAR